MRNFLVCRRTFIAVLAIAAITFLGCYIENIDACYALASISVSLCAANAYENSKKLP